MDDNGYSLGHDNQWPKVLQLYLTISQYPVLSRVIRQRMRDELFARGIVTPSAFEEEVRQKAIASQRREGIINPLFEEGAEDWDKRVRYIRAHLTDFYFAYNLPHALFEALLGDVLQRRAPDREVRLTFNPEIAPWDLLFAEGARYEAMADGERTNVQHHLREIIVVLIKAMISDHLQFVRLAKQVFTVEDLRVVRRSRIGRGKIGGKAAGMLLAWKLLQHAGTASGVDPDLVKIPDSYYVGSDVFYEVHELNGFHAIMNQKYKSREKIIAEAPEIRARYAKAELPVYIVAQLRELMEQVGHTPLIFRSSSLLEDSFATAFAGKYDSFFLPNKGTPKENLTAAIRAIMMIYASTLGPDALIYRQRMGLVDFDERMAILIQTVEGRKVNGNFFPAIAGVGYSRNPFRWSPKIRREDGLLRMVCGLGTRAVDRAGADYPRMIALSHPHLRPETRTEQLRRYSQQLIDVIDLAQNKLETKPIREVIDVNFPALRLVASHDTGQHIERFVTRPTTLNPSEVVFTFDGLAADQQFTSTMRHMLKFLEKSYGCPVDIEYAIDVVKTYPQFKFQISLLQCRPLRQADPGTKRRIPKNVPAEDQLFSAGRLIPDGVVERIRYIVYVQPAAYYAVLDQQRRIEVGRVIGRLNERLGDEVFVLMAPGRWGTSDLHLGVMVSYADIYNSKALIEVAYRKDGTDEPDMAYGSHFFQDLVEADIYPLALYPDDPGAAYDWDFFEDAPNCLPDLLPDDASMAGVITVIDVPTMCDGKLLEIVMDGDRDEALGYLRYYYD
ncbi:MAG: PEP/pyruvate-binding domain-containing protein [Anaerolineae bacterium]|nr:PEP/pyruvate-binding domain-containing protein [Anaerolineae bacterium]